MLPFAFVGLKQWLKSQKAVEEERQAPEEGVAGHLAGPIAINWAYLDNMSNGGSQFPASVEDLEEIPTSHPADAVAAVTGSLVPTPTIINTTTTNTNINTTPISATNEIHDENSFIIEFSESECASPPPSLPPRHFVAPPAAPFPPHHVAMRARMSEVARALQNLDKNEGPWTFPALHKTFQALAAVEIQLQGQLAEHYAMGRYMGMPSLAALAQTLSPPLVACLLDGILTGKRAIADAAVALANASFGVSGGGVAAADGQRVGHLVHLLRASVQQVVALVPPKTFLHPLYLMDIMLADAMLVLPPGKTVDVPYIGTISGGNPALAAEKGDDGAEEAGVAGRHVGLNPVVQRAFSRALKLKKWGGSSGATSGRSTPSSALASVLPTPKQRGPSRLGLC